MTSSTTTMKSTKTTTSALRLYLIALLAMAYLFVWWALGLRPPRSSAATLEDDRSQATPPAVREQRSVVWYAELPPAERPLLHLPKGWRIVTPTAVPAYATYDAPPPVVRIVPSRPKRLRTRSS